MNYGQAGQVKPYPGPLGPSPDMAYQSAVGIQANPPSENNHSILNRALERLSIQVQVTGKIAQSLGAPIPQTTGQNSAPCNAEPTVTDKLYALHQLLALLENDLDGIARTIG